MNIIAFSIGEKLLASDLYKFIRNLDILHNKINAIYTPNIGGKSTPQKGLTLDSNDVHAYGDIHLSGKFEVIEAMRYVIEFATQHKIYTYTTNTITKEHIEKLTDQLHKNQAVFNNIEKTALQEMVEGVIIPKIINISKLMKENVIKLTY